MINKNDLRKAISSIAISNAKRNTIYKAFSDLDSITKEEFDSVKSDISKVVESMLTKDTVGKANGVASLDSNGSVPIEQLGNIDTTLFLIVRELPTTDIKTNKIYLIPNKDSQGNNIYVEYLYVDNAWENLGEFKAEVDLSEYVNKHELAATESAIQKQIATKANSQDVTNAIGELNDKIGDRVVVSGNVTNNPDEEDITTEGDTPQTQVLKLKDRAYDSLNASGKGYKILRKNWQTINRVRKNVLTQAMINEPNTIYEIRYDFDLNGAEIAMQDGCILKFEGGSLSNGSVKGKNTEIRFTNPFIGSNASFKSSYVINDLDNTKVFTHINHSQKEIQQLIDLSGQGIKIKLDTAEYTEIDTINISRDIDIDFNNSTFNLKTEISKSPEDPNSKFSCEFLVMPFLEEGIDSNIKSVKLKNLYVNGGCYDYLDYSKHDVNIYHNPRRNCIRICSVDNVEFFNLNIKGFRSGGSGNLGPIRSRWQSNTISVTYPINFLFDRGELDTNNSEQLVVIPKNIKNNFSKITNLVAHGISMGTIHIYSGACYIANNYFYDCGDNGNCIEAFCYNSIIENNSGVNLGSPLIYISEGSLYMASNVLIRNNSVINSEALAVVAGSNIEIIDNYAKDVEFFSYYSGNTENSNQVENPLNKTRNLTTLKYQNNTCIGSKGGITYNGSRSKTSYDTIYILDNYIELISNLINGRYLPINLSYSEKVIIKGNYIKGLFLDKGFSSNYSILAIKSSVNLAIIDNNEFTENEDESITPYNHLSLVNSYTRLSNNTFNLFRDFKITAYRITTLNNKFKTKIPNLLSVTLDSHNNNYAENIYTIANYKYSDLLVRKGDILEGYGLNQYIVSEGGLNPQELRLNFNGKKLEYRNFQYPDGSIWRPYSSGIAADTPVDTSGKQVFDIITDGTATLYKVADKKATIYCSKGTTNQRPTLISTDEGFEYYDITLKKKILWNGTAWVNMDGSSLGEQPTQDESL